MRRLRIAFSIAVCQTDSMARWTRFIVSLLLAGAIPCQGIAAVTMVGCHPDHEGAAGESSAPHHHVHHVHHAIASGSAGAERHAVSHRQHANDSAPAAHRDRHSEAGSVNKLATSQPLKGKCGVCESCAAATAIPIDAISLDPVAPTGFIASLALSGFAAVLAEGLERPPRPAHS